MKKFRNSPTFRFPVMSIYAIHSLLWHIQHLQISNRCFILHITVTFINEKAKTEIDNVSLPINMRVYSKEWVWGKGISRKQEHKAVSVRVSLRALHVYGDPRNWKGYKFGIDEDY